ncbi:hypothetical protein ACPVPU_00480 [Sphingomonas sp. CJ99]
MPTDRDAMDEAMNPGHDSLQENTESRTKAKSNATQGAPNISTEHQRPGDAGMPSDTLDRGRPQEEDDGGRRSSLTGD